MGSLRAFLPARTVPLATPPPGGPAHARGPRPSLFPPGLAVNVQAATGEALAAAAAGWDVHYAQLGAGRGRGRWMAVHTASLQIGLEDWSLAVLKRGRAPRGSVTFVVPVGRGGSARLQGRPVVPGGAVVLFDGDELDYRSAGPARLVSVSVERGALEAHVRALVGRHLGELRLQGGLRSLRTDDATLWRLAHDLVRRATAQPRVLRDGLLARGLERKLIRLLVAGFEAPRVAEAFSPGRALARRAEAWLRQNLTEPPSIAALCAGVQASERTLHEAFREHLGTTPKAYLKTLRLNAARHDLLRAARGSVTDVALDWGFVHFGWFSQHYRRLFGETPSQTLRRGRAEAGRGVRGSRPPEGSRRVDPGALAGAYVM